MRWPSRCLAAVILVFFLTSADGQRGSRRFNPSNVNDVPEEEATTARSHRFQNRDRSKSEDVPRQDFPRRDAEVLPTRSAPSRVQLRSRNEVSSRDSRPGKEVPIVSSGAVEYERLQQPETTRRTHTPRVQTLSGSSQPEESKFSRSRGDGSSRAGSTEARRPASRFPKRDSIGSTDGNTVQPITDEPTTRRSFSRPRGSPSSSSQSEPPSRLPSRGSFRKATEAPMENFSPRSQADALRTTKNIPEVRSRTGGRSFQGEREDTTESPDSRSRSRNSSRGSSNLLGRQSQRNGDNSRDTSRGRDMYSRTRPSERFPSRTRIEEVPTIHTTVLPSTPGPYVEPSTEPAVREEVTLPSPEVTSSLASPLARGVVRTSNRGRGSARASPADLKSGGLKEKETDEVSDNDNYPEVYKQLVKSGTDPKDILVPKYKQLISKYAKKPSSSGLDSRTVSPRPLKTTVRTYIDDVQPTFMNERVITTTETENFFRQKSEITSEDKPSKKTSHLRKQTSSLNEYSIKTTLPPKTTLKQNQYTYKNTQKPKPVENINQYSNGNSLFQSDLVYPSAIDDDGNHREKTYTSLSPKTPTPRKQLTTTSKSSKPYQNKPSTNIPEVGRSRPKTKNFHTKEFINYVEQSKPFRHSERDTESRNYNSKPAKQPNTRIPVLTFDNERVPTAATFGYPEPKTYKGPSKDNNLKDDIDYEAIVTPPKLFRNHPKPKATTPKYLMGFQDSEKVSLPKLVTEQPQTKFTQPKYQTTVEEWDNRFVNGEYVSFKPQNDPSSKSPKKANLPLESYIPPVLEPGFQFHDFAAKPRQKPRLGSFQNYWDSQTFSLPSFNKPVDDPHDSHVSVRFNQDNRGSWGVDYSLANSRYQERNFAPKKRTMAERSANERILSQNVQPYIHHNPFGNQQFSLPQNSVTRWGFTSQETQYQSPDFSYNGGGHFISLNNSTIPPSLSQFNPFEQNPVLHGLKSYENSNPPTIQVSKSNPIFEATYYENPNAPLSCTLCETTVQPTAYSVKLNGRTFHKIETPHTSELPFVDEITAKATTPTVAITPPFISRTKQNPKIENLPNYVTAASSTTQETRSSSYNNQNDIFKRVRSTVRPSHPVTPPFVSRANTSQKPVEDKYRTTSSGMSGLRTNNIFKNTKTTSKPLGDWNPYSGLNKNKSRKPETTTGPNPVVTKEYNPTIYAFNGKQPSATTPKTSTKAKAVSAETSNNIILNLVNIFRRFFGPPL